MQVSEDNCRSSNSIYQILSEKPINVHKCTEIMMSKLCVNCIEDVFMNAMKYRLSLNPDNITSRALMQLWNLRKERLTNTLKSILVGIYSNLQSMINSTVYLFIAKMCGKSETPDAGRYFFTWLESFMPLGSILQILISVIAIDHTDVFLHIRSMEFFDVQSATIHCTFTYFASIGRSWMIKWLTDKFYFKVNIDIPQYVGSIIGNNLELLGELTTRNATRPSSNDITGSLIFSGSIQMIDKCLQLSIEFCAYQLCLGLVSSYIQIKDKRLMNKLNLKDVLNILTLMDLKGYISSDEFKAYALELNIILGIISPLTAVDANWRPIDVHRFLTLAEGAGSLDGPSATTESLIFFSRSEEHSSVCFLL